VENLAKLGAVAKRKHSAKILTPKIKAL